MDVAFDKMLAIVQSFVEKRKGALGKSIGRDTPLLQGGYLDSFALVELIAELEKQLGICLPDGALIPEDFESPEVLYNRLQEI